MSPSSLSLGVHRPRLLPEATLSIPNDSPTAHVLTFRGAADVSRGTGIGRALGILGKGILPRPVKVVCQILGIATDLFVLEVTGVVCVGAQAVG